MRTRSSKKYRVAIGLREIVGYFINLEKGFQRLGVEAHFIDVMGHTFNYGKSSVRMPVITLARKVGQLFASTKRKNIFRRYFYAATWLLLRIIIMFWTAYRYDVLIFGFGETFTNSELELRLYRLLNKKIIFLFLGSDSRPAYIGAYFPAGTNPDWALAHKISRKQKNNLKKIERYADYLINIPPQAHFHERRFVNGLLFGLPYDLKAKNLVQEEITDNRAVRILHSPSRPEVKGTREFTEAIEHMKNKGYEIDFIMIQGMPNSKVLEEIQQCDFILDELYSDTPMAGFATEAAHFGKPAAVGGYFAEQMRNYYREEDIPPSLFVHPDKIESAIEKLITDADYRLDLGKRAYEFVKSRWLPEHIAVKFLRLIEDDVPDEWWLDPYKIRYVHGAGLPEWRAKEIVRGLVERYGVSALQLGDKPELEKLFLDFAGVHKDTGK